MLEINTVATKSLTLDFKHVQLSAPQYYSSS